MSDRLQLFVLETQPGERVRLYMDGESGTWRLFVDNPANPHGNCVDLSLKSLLLLRAQLDVAIVDILRQPEISNAEHRRLMWAEVEP